MRCRGVHRVANAAYLGGFLCSGLHRIALAVVQEWCQEYARRVAYIPGQLLGFLHGRCAYSALDSSAERLHYRFGYAHICGASVKDNGRGVLASLILRDQP
jgi:hypothetical protein